MGALASCVNRYKVGVTDISTQSAQFNTKTDQSVEGQDEKPELVLNSIQEIPQTTVVTDLRIGDASCLLRPESHQHDIGTTLSTRTNIETRPRGTLTCTSRVYGLMSAATKDERQGQDISAQYQYDSGLLPGQASPPTNERRRSSVSDVGSTVPSNRQEGGAWASKNAHHEHEDSTEPAFEIVEETQPSSIALKSRQCQLTTSTAWHEVKNTYTSDNIRIYGTEILPLNISCPSGDGDNEGEKACHTMNLGTLKEPSCTNEDEYEGCTTIDTAQSNNKHEEPLTPTNIPPWKCIYSAGDHSDRWNRRNLGEGRGTTSTSATYETSPKPLFRMNEGEEFLYSLEEILQSTLPCHVDTMEVAAVTGTEISQQGPGLDPGPSPELEYLPYCRRRMLLRENKEKWLESDFVFGRGSAHTGTTEDRDGRGWQDRSKAVGGDVGNDVEDGRGVRHDQDNFNPAEQSEGLAGADESSAYQSLLGSRREGVDTSTVSTSVQDQAECLSLETDPPSASEDKLKTGQSERIQVSQASTTQTPEACPVTVMTIRASYGGKGSKTANIRKAGGDKTDDAVAETQTTRTLPERQLVTAGPAGLADAITALLKTLCDQKQFPKARRKRQKETKSNDELPESAETDTEKVSATAAESVSPASLQKNVTMDNTAECDSSSARNGSAGLLGKTEYDAASASWNSGTGQGTKPLVSLPWPASTFDQVSIGVAKDKHLHTIAPVLEQIDWSTCEVVACSTAAAAAVSQQHSSQQSQASLTGKLNDEVCLIEDEAKNDAVSLDSRHHQETLSKSHPLQKQQPGQGQSAGIDPINKDLASWELAQMQSDMTPPEQTLCTSTERAGLQNGDGASSCKSSNPDPDKDNGQDKITPNSTKAEPLSAKDGVSNVDRNANNSTRIKGWPPSFS